MAGAQKPVLLKIGGSVLTDKSKPRALRRASAKRIGGELLKAGVPCVIVHGGGSFGHPEAKAARLGTEIVTPQRRSGVSRVLAAMATLHAHVLEALTDAGLKPLGIPLHATARSNDGVVDSWPLEAIREALEEGFTPVLHGTLIRDDALGWRVLSGDEIVSELAGELQPRLTLFLSDVEGVLQDGAVLETLTPGAHHDLLEAQKPDVTGGMLGKVRHALMASECSPTMLISGLERGRVLDAIRGKTVPCTRFLPE